MKQNRRAFLKLVTGAGALMAMGFTGTRTSQKRGPVKIVLLHTNDVHSHIDPFPDNDPKYAGLGGVERRASLIKKIRAEEEHVLLLDAGDIFQGTPYFNLYGGELEMKLMSEMGYDASTIGNHDFDAGLDNLAKQMAHATFPMINCNYDFTGTPMEGKTQPYKIFNKGGVLIGVFGLGIEMAGLVDKKLYGKTQYLDPIVKAAEMVNLLKDEKKCDVVICLSHLGYKYDNNPNKISDIVLARKSRGIDLIIGAHTHTFLDQTVIFQNREMKPVHIAQAGWAGIRLGKITINVDKKTKKTSLKGHTVTVSKKSSV